MSSVLATKYAQIALVGAFDLVSGETIATIISACFPSNPVFPLNMTNSELGKIMFSVGLQLVLTLWVGEEVRDFFLSGTTDPTGGILFILTLFKQPNFWEKVDVCVAVISDMILGLVTRRNEDSGPDE